MHPHSTKMRASHTARNLRTWRLSLSLSYATHIIYTHTHGFRNTRAGRDPLKRERSRNFVSGADVSRASATDCLSPLECRWYAESACDVRDARVYRRLFRERIEGKVRRMILFEQMRTEGNCWWVKGNWNCRFFYRKIIYFFYAWRLIDSASYICTSVVIVVYMEMYSMYCWLFQDCI